MLQAHATLSVTQTKPTNQTACVHACVWFLAFLAGQLRVEFCSQRRPSVDVLFMLLFLLLLLLLLLTMVMQLMQ